jgi:hypothetical protein
MKEGTGNAYRRRPVLPLVPDSGTFTDARGLQSPIAPINSVKMTEFLQELAAQPHTAPPQYLGWFERVELNGQRHEREFFVGVAMK